MIAKHIPMRSAKKSDFMGLVEYITGEQSKNVRIGYVSVTNCQASRPDSAIAEVLNTQDQNSRAESDKTYHLIVSFRAGEQPDDATMKAIEARICEGLGFGEHQRVSAVHHDTDNLHIHIAINKIHPLRHTIHAPYYDHKILGQLCEALEHDYGLESDNHQAQKGRAENRAADMENHAGIESLLGWIKRECQMQIQAAQSWTALHQVMRDNGLALRERGNGLVVVAEDGTMVKASSIDRDLSKGKLETRFGSFESSPEQQAKTEAKPARKYNRQPMPSRINTVELYAKYKAEQQSRGVLRSSSWKKIRDRKNRQIADVKRIGTLKRSAIKLMVGGGTNKKVLYATLSKVLKDEIQKINKHYLKDRQAIFDKYQRLAWADWLRIKAMAGDHEALGALRARKAAQGLKGNTISGSGQQTPLQILIEKDSISKKGTIIYRVGSTAVRDDGDRLNVARGATQEDLQVALRLATARYGERIKVNGTADFKEHIAQAAAAANLAITFDDAALEQRRQTLLQSTPTQEPMNEHTRVRTDRGRINRSGNSGSGLATNRNNRAGRAMPTVPGGGLPGKPNIGRIGRKPPPAGKNRLRGLSELGVVCLAGRSEVLLPGHVPGHLEQQCAKPDNVVRRDIFGSGTLTDGLVAADKYIAERETKRLKEFDIPKHSRYNYNLIGAVAFAGIRQVEGQILVLLKRSDEIMVLPIDDATALRLKRVAVGDVVTVTPKGAIKTKGKKR